MPGAHRCARYPSRTRALRDDAGALPPEDPPGGAWIRNLIGWAVYVLVEQKAWGTFAFLFGSGFGIFLRRLEARHVRVTPVYLRRLAMLAIFGIIADICFGFRILFGYACSGLVLFVIRRWRTRALLVAAGVSACARPMAAEITAWYRWWTGAAPAGDAGAALRQSIEAAAQQSDYFGVLRRALGPLPGFVSPHLARPAPEYQPGALHSRVSCRRSPRARRADPPCKADYAMDDVRCSLVGVVMAPLAPPSGNACARRGLATR